MKYGRNTVEINPTSSGEITLKINSNQLTLASNTAQIKVKMSRIGQLLESF
jgi:hypothetical protein